MTLSPTEIVRHHIEAVRAFKFSERVAPSARWIWRTASHDHSIDPSQAYRSVMQAWNFPIQSATIEETKDGLVRAELTLDNGNNYRKHVVAEYTVVEGEITGATLNDAEAKAYNG